MNVKLENYFVLDIGCADAPVGDVNCDLFIDDVHNHRTDKLGNRRHIDGKTIPNFVQCSAGHLPFKDGCFDLVNSRQVFEHLPPPESCASEMVRCSRDLVLIETVHRRGERLLSKERYREFNKVHCNKLDFKYFGQLAKKLKVNYIWSETLSFNYFIHFGDFQFFKAPFVIRIVFSKKQNDWAFFCNRKMNPKNWYLRHVGL